MGSIDAKYVPPKMTAVDPDSKSLTRHTKKQDKLRERASRSRIVKDIAADLSEAPLEVDAEDDGTYRPDDNDRERQKFEEDYFTRLSDTKADKQKRKRKLQQNALSVRSPLNTHINLSLMFVTFVCVIAGIE